MKILLIEDDFVTARSVESLLARNGIVCDVAEYGEQGLELSKQNDYDLIILDLMLPDIDGFEVLLRLRSTKIKVPVLILSAVSDSDKKVKMLNYGADDYVTKPYVPIELVARIHAIVRRTKGHAMAVIGFNQLSINFDNREVDINGTKIVLTNTEYSILEFLATRKGTVVTKVALFEHLYKDPEIKPDVKTIDVFMCKLRKKLAVNGENYIITQWGRGYEFKEDHNTEENVTEAVVQTT
jgi:two-component system cell cycle response regulator CtrA